MKKNQEDALKILALIDMGYKVNEKHKDKAVNILDNNKQLIADSRLTNEIDLYIGILSRAERIDEFVSKFEILKEKYKLK